jgi:hypothetical protein
MSISTPVLNDRYHCIILRALYSTVIKRERRPLTMPILDPLHDSMTPEHLLRIEDDQELQMIKPTQ